MQSLREPEQQERVIQRGSWTGGGEREGGGIAQAVRGAWQGTRKGGRWAEMRWDGRLRTPECFISSARPSQGPRRWTLFTCKRLRLCCPLVHPQLPSGKSFF